MAQDPASRTNDGLGPSEAGPLTAIVDDPARAEALRGLGVEEAIAELSRACRAPILARRRAGELVCVSPSRRVALLRLAAREGLCADECSYRLVDGLSDAAAEALGGFVDHWLEQRATDPKWRQGVLERYAQLAAFEGEPWMRGGVWRTAGDACGTHTSAFMRVKGVQERCTPGVLAEVDAGRIGLWSAYELSQLPPGEQDRIVADAAAGPATITELVREAKEPLPSVRDVIRQVARIDAAVRAGKAMPDVASVMALHSAVAKLSESALAGWTRGKDGRGE